MVLFAPQKTWTVEFTGKPGFGHLTRVFALPDRLIFLDSPPPTVSDGGDIYLWRDKDVKPTKVFSVQEQGIQIIRQLGTSIVVPGLDAMENWDWGNWYASDDKGESWTKYRNLPKAMHVFDAAEWQRKFYMGICDPTGAVVSSSNGKEWKKEFGHASADSFGEVISLVPLPDALYAFWVEQWGAVPLEANKKVDCYRFDGHKWEPRMYLPNPTAVWHTRVLGSCGFLLLPGRSYLLRDDKATPVLSVDGLVPLDVEVLDRSTLIWLAAGSHYDFALYRTSFDGVKAEVGKRTKIVDLPTGLYGDSLAIHAGKVWVSCTASPSGKLVSFPLSDAIR